MVGGISVCCGGTSTIMKSKNKKCISCGREDQPNFSKKRCKGCAQKDYAKKAPEKAFTTSSSSESKKKTASKIVKNHKNRGTGQAALFEVLRATREPISFISGIPVDVDIATTYAHILSKAQNKYPKFKLYDKNIVFLTPTEHHILDHGTIEQRQKYKDMMWKDNKVFVDWNKLYILREELLKEYNNNPTGR